VEAIDQDLMKLWKKMPKANASLHYPRENKFLTNDFSLRDVGISNSTGPTCMVDEKMNFWYKQSSTFKVPIASIYIRINFKGSCDNDKNCTSSELFILLLNDRLSGVISQVNNLFCL
jgi:secreted Zn-dependent insulinase-like peptidase